MIMLLNSFTFRNCCYTWSAQYIGCILLEVQIICYFLWSGNRFMQHNMYYAMHFRHLGAFRIYVQIAGSSNLSCLMY